MALSFCGRRILTTKKLYSLNFRQHGYIVLVPEIGEDLPEKNPLLQNDGLPEFNNITIEKCMAAITKQTLEFEVGVVKIENTINKKEKISVFDDIFKPLEELTTSLDVTWGLSKTLYLSNSTLMPTKSYLSIHERAKRARAVKFNSRLIYNAVKNELNKTIEKYNEDARILKKFALEGKLNGLELNNNKRIQLKQYLIKLATERTYFKKKNDISTKLFSFVIEDYKIVKHFPLGLLKNLSNNKTNYLNGPWTITLQPHIYMPVMENCPERDIRWNMWLASVNRGSGYSNKETITSVHIENIRKIRKDIANVLGYKTFVDMSMETKMAGNVDNVYNVINLLLQRAKPIQDQEIKNLYEFAVENGFKGDRMELWDVPYWKRKQQLSQFNYTEDDYKKYFPVENVLNGLFKLTENLFNIIIKHRNNISTWHKDVKFFDIFESYTSAPIGGFYIDLFARSEEKMKLPLNQGWMVGIQNQSRITNTKPLAALVFNFDPPSNESPSLLNFKEIKSLFHKFGQALQHLLTQTNFSEVSGSSNIEWDAIEVTGHFLTHWLYDKNTINNISSHCDTGNKLPEEMFQSLILTNTHLAGTDLCNELYLSSLDLELHYTDDYWLEIVKRLWSEFRSFKLDKLDSHPCSFTQIFTEEWGAAYYSHIWSRIIAADIYNAFDEAQGNNQKIKEIGKGFRNTFLSLGGSCHPSEIFRKFRGRDPSPEALLKSLNLKKSN